MKKVPEKYIINEIIEIKIQSILKILLGLLIFSNKKMSEYDNITRAHTPVVIESKLLIELNRFSYAIDSKNNIEPILKNNLFCL
jgi:uncharacterized membrane protein YwaF